MIPTWVPLSVLESPCEGEKVENAFWPVHPSRGVLFYFYEEQGIHKGLWGWNRRFLDRVCPSIAMKDGSHEVRAMPVAYLGHVPNLDRQPVRHV